MAAVLRNKLLQSFRDLSYFVNFTIEVILKLFSSFNSRNVSSLVVARQILFTGVNAAGLIILAAAVIGVIVIAQAVAISPNLSQSQMLIAILVTVITKELGTFIPALIIIARSGTAISTELGNMVINNEVEAIISFGISPISYLVVPRTIGVLLAIIPLAVYFNFVAFLSSGLFLQFGYGIDFIDYAAKLSAAVNPADFILTLIKSVFYGLTIAVICCYNGLAVKRASTEVPQRTSRAVVQSFAGVILFDIFIILIFNLL